MYSRSAQGRFPRDLRVPKNYAGNAFKPIIEAEVNAEPVSAEPQKTDAPVSEDISHEAPQAENEKAESAGLFKLPKFNLGLGKLFSRGGINIGFEELLLIGIIFLIANEGGNDDLILLLLLLLFIQ